MSHEDPTSADLPEVPTWAAPLTAAQYADAVRCADQAPPLSGRQRAAIRSIFGAAASGTHDAIGGAE